MPRPQSPKDRFVCTVLGWPLDTLEHVGAAYTHEGLLPTRWPTGDVAAFTAAFLPHVLEEARAIVHSGLRYVGALCCPRARAHPSDVRSQ